MNWVNKWQEKKKDESSNLEIFLLFSDEKWECISDEKMHPALLETKGKGRNHTSPAKSSLEQGKIGSTIDKINYNYTHSYTCFKDKVIQHSICDGWAVGETMHWPNTFKIVYASSNIERNTLTSLFIYLFFTLTSLAEC